MTEYGNIVTEFVAKYANFIILCRPEKELRWL